jgi:hypothetical protein
MRTILKICLILFSFCLCISHNLKQIQKKENKNNSFNHSLFYISNIKCSNLNCPFPNFCNDSLETCFCAKGYINDPRNPNLQINCSYKQYKQLNSFLWEIFTNFGIGHLIIGNYISGICKIILNLFLLLLCMLFYGNSISENKNKNDLRIKLTLIIYLSFLCWFIWWVVDAFSFGFNKYNDINNLPLMKW